MRTASPALVSLLETRQFLSADLYDFALPGGATLRYTSWESDLSGYSSALGWERTQAKWSIGLNIDTMDVTLQATPDQLVNGVVPIIESIAGGDWDGATCTVSRAFMAISDPDTIVGTIVIFPGWIGDIGEIGRIHAKLQLQSKTALLNVGLPKALFGPSCRHVLFDSGCGLSRAGFTVSGTVASGSTASVVQTGASPASVIPGPTAAPTLSSVGASGVNLPHPTTYYVTITYTTAYGETVASPEASLTITSSDHLLHVASPASAGGATGWNAYVGLGPGDEQLQNGSPIAIGTGFTIPAGGVYLSGQRSSQTASQGWYALGVITFTSGANAGRKRVIESNSGGALTLRVPLPVAPLAGDTFAMSPGCDHTMATCQNKFSNLIHFGGTPFVPVPEAASA